MTRVWIYLLVVVTWISIMTQLWLREGGRIGRSLVRMGISPEVLLVSWIDYEHWLWIEQYGKRIGLTTLLITPAMTRSETAAGTNEPPGYQMRSRTAVSMRLMGLELPIEVVTRVGMNSAFELETLQCALRLAGQQIRIQAFVEASSLYYRARLDGETSATESGGLAGLNFNPLAGMLAQLPMREVCGRAPLSEPIFMTEAVIPVLTRSEKIKSGQSWVTTAGNPLGGALHSEVRVDVEKKETVKVGDAPLEAWRIVERVGAMKCTAWYDMVGKLVLSEMDGGLRMVQAVPTQATAEYPSFKGGDGLTEKIDRPWIKAHLDEKLNGKPLGQLVPALPGL